MVATTSVPSDRPSLVSLAHLLIRAFWLAVVFGVLAVFAAPAAVLAGDPLGGLLGDVTDTVTDTTDTVIDEVVEPVVEATAPVVEATAPVVEAATGAAAPVADDAAAAIAPAVEALPLEVLPEVTADVEVTLPGVDASVSVAVGTPDALVGASLNAGVGSGLPLIDETLVVLDAGVVAGPGLDTDVSVGLGVTLPGGDGVGVTIDPPPIGVLPPLQLPPLIPGIEIPPSEQPAFIGPPPTAEDTGGTQPILASGAARAPAPSAVPSDPATRNDPMSAAARAFARLAGQLGSGLIGQGGVALGGALALLTLLALVPPLTRGGVLRALAIWKPMPFVARLDPPG